MPIAICPSPPMLVPEVAQGASDDLLDLRTRCDAAVRRLLDRGADTITVIGSAPARGRWIRTAGGTLRGFGPDVRAGGDDLVLPLSLTIGAWLLDRAGWGGARSYVAVTGDEAVEVRGPVLVMADGTAKRSESAPGHIDDRAPTYDKVIAEALANGDARTLAGLDPALAQQLWAAGAPSLRVLGRSVGATEVVRARLTYDAAPFGVGYFVAEWDLAA
ncbi:MAG: class III extradiol dioxygenase subunit B-like domain-containing protein [Nocardioidaceae bacterium]